MMAKMFYRFDEARQVLGMTDEQLRQLTREGKLREFRDGTQVMYKADQVDLLKSEMGLGGEADLGPSDTAGPIGLADSRGESAGGSVISLADSASKEDTAADMALGGSALGGSGSGTGTGIALNSPGSTRGGSGVGTAAGTGGGTAIGLASSNTGTGIGLAGTGMGTGMGGSGTRASQNSGTGVSVLGLDEGGNADANAATAMGGSFGGEPSMEAMGSGSGLLDLSRERDDTSLGAPVLDEISGGGSRSGSGGAISGAPLTGGGAAAVAARAGTVPVYVEASDNFAGFAAGASAAAAAFAVLALYAVAAAASHAEPTLLGFLKNGGSTYPMLWVLGAGLLVAIVLGMVGFLIGKRR